MVKSPSCWIDPFQMKPDRRRTTKITKTAEPMSRDVIELKQAPLWHGGKILIDQACEAAAEGMVRQPKALRISFRSEEVGALSGTHQEHTKSLQTSHLASCISSPSAVELSQMSGRTCREQNLTDASDSSMCGSNCASRPGRACSSSRKISRGKTFRWRPFLLLTYLVVTASTAQLCLMTQDEIRERKLREAQETRNRLRSANQEQQVAERKGKYRNQKPSPTVIPATIDRDLDPSKRPPTGGWVMQTRIVRILSNRERFARTHIWNG